MIRAEWLDIKLWMCTWNSNLTFVGYKTTSLGPKYNQDQSPNFRQKNNFEEKITIALDNYQISKYRVSNKEVFKNDDNYKVFVEVAFKKKELFKSLDKINID